jgi:hypothetical protein
MLATYHQYHSTVGIYIQTSSTTISLLTNVLNELMGLGRVVVFNTTFNNISVISWQSVLLVEETGVPEKTTDLLQVITEQTDYFTPNEK